MGDLKMNNEPTENQTVYLRNGQAANFVKKIDDKNYIVQPELIYYYHDGSQDSDYGETTVVENVYLKPPSDKIAKDFLEKIQAVKNKTDALLLVVKEVNEAERKLRRVQSFTTDLEKGIINKEAFKTADSITVFSDRIEPYVLSKKMKRNLKIMMTISVSRGEEVDWCYEAYEDGDWSSGVKIDKKYGFLFDIKEGELLRITKERALKIYVDDFSKNNTLKRTDDKYLPDSLIEVKKGLLKTEANKSKERIMLEIENQKLKLKELERCPQ